MTEKSDPTPTPDDDPSGRVSAKVEVPNRILNADQVKSLTMAAEDFRSAQRQMSDAMGVLWNSQLDMAMMANNTELLSRVMVRPLGLWDDCSCGCGGGTPSHW